MGIDITDNGAPDPDVGDENVTAKDQDNFEEDDDAQGVDVVAK